MRLLNTTKLHLEEIANCNVTQYAILSHRWRDGEVTLDDLHEDHRRAAETKAGFQKINISCKQAVHDGFDHIWVDTCCIDKSSSSELSEAINSMYRWYENAEVCYAYLFDVPDGTDPFTDADGMFANSQWFTRGWTLQELIAPKRVVFFSQGWVELGTRLNLRHTLTKITGIDQRVLDGTRDLRSVSIAKRISWAAKRETSRPEDEAYCLMGLFNINMPMLYGEGGEKAFVRLQEHIIQDSDDESIFAWTDRSATPDDDDALHGLLATSPKHFADSGNFLSYCNWEDRSLFSKTNRGLQISLNTEHVEGDVYTAALNCPAPALNYSGFLGIFLKRLADGHGSSRAQEKGQAGLQHYARIRIDKLPLLNKRGTTVQTLYVRQSFPPPTDRGVYPDNYVIQLRHIPEEQQHGYKLVRTLGWGISAGCAPSAKWVWEDRDWITQLMSEFAVRKGEPQLAAVLVFMRVADGSKFSVLMGSTADFGIVVDVQEGKQQYDDQSLNWVGGIDGWGIQPGDEIMTSFGPVLVDVEEHTRGGKRFYVTDITVKENTAGNPGGVGVVAGKLSRRPGEKGEKTSYDPRRIMHKKGAATEHVVNGARERHTSSGLSSSIIALLEAESEQARRYRPRKTRQGATYIASTFGRTSGGIM